MLTASAGKLATSGMCSQADCVEKPATVIEAHAELGKHTWYGLNMVLSGSGTYIDQNKQRHALRPGVIFQRIPHQLHAIHIDSDCYWSEVYISMREKTFDHLYQLGLIHDCPIYYLKHPEIILNQFKNVLELMDQAHSRRVPNILLGIQNLLISVHENAEREWDPDPYRRPIAEACEILDCHLDEDVDMESIAEHIGMSYETFRKAFKERTRHCSRRLSCAQAHRTRLRAAAQNRIAG